MNKSETIGEIAKALCKAQDEMGGAAKSSTNPFFNSSYSALPEVIKAIKEPFCNHGLSYSQFPVVEDGRAGVITILMHTSGEWLESKLLLPVAKQDAQATGSAITYARRYALQSIAGIPSEDDDGNAASAPAAKKDVSKLQAHIESCGFTVQQVCESYQVKSLSELTDFNAVANQVTQWAKG